MQVGRRRNLRVHPSVRTSRVCRNPKSDSDDPSMDGWVDRWRPGGADRTEGGGGTGTDEARGAGTAVAADREAREAPDSRGHRWAGSRERRGVVPGGGSRRRRQIQGDEGAMGRRSSCSRIHGRWCCGALQMEAWGEVEGSRGGRSEVRSFLSLAMRWWRRLSGG